MKLKFIYYCYFPGDNGVIDEGFCYFLVILLTPKLLMQLEAPSLLFFLILL